MQYSLRMKPMGKWVVCLVLSRKNSGPIPSRMLFSLFEILKLFFFAIHRAPDEFTQ